MFQFQQFTVHDDQCAHKVGTDGVLLGAWANVDAANRILDVGTGSGLVALMLAQRNSTATIDAIDVDKAAVDQATDNFASSPWSRRLQAHLASAASFAAKPGYDLVISNPPFFPGGATVTASRRRSSRLDGRLTIDALFDATARLMVERGRVCLIWPASRLDACFAAASSVGLGLAVQVNVAPLPNRLAHRTLLEFRSDYRSAPRVSDLIIERAKHDYTCAYRELTQAFYL